jgi:putative tricarboxylic transport membrane protein
MGVIEMLRIGISNVCTPIGLLLVVIGTGAGIAFGAAPGLSVSTAVIMVLPLTYGMAQGNAMTLLMSLWIGTVSGGLVAAIMLNIPGTPAALATTFDGYPMAQKGEAVKALGAGIVFSFIGSILSIIVLIAVAPRLARLAIEFGPFEYFGVVLFALMMIATLASGNMLKGLIAAFFGVILCTVGYAPIDSTPRYTFGLPVLENGIELLPSLIGIFAMGELIILAKNSRSSKAPEVRKMPDLKHVKGFGFSWKEFWHCIPTCLRGSALGIGIGILPGIGGSTSSLISYTLEKNISRRPERFGTGIIEGVVATESSNNAAVGGATVPLLTLGIPGDGSGALFLGAFMVHGLSPGPLLFKNSGPVVYTIFVAMILASVAMLFMEFYGLRIFIRILSIKRHILMPVILCLCMVGLYGIGNSMYHLYLALFFAVLGYIYKAYKIPHSPMVLGFVLGSMAEEYLRRGLMYTDGNFAPFITASPIATIFFAAAFITLGLSIFREVRNMRKEKADSAA